MAEHPLNADGDFYVEHGCCTACEVPSYDASVIAAQTPIGIDVWFHRVIWTSAITRQLNLSNHGFAQSSNAILNTNRSTLWLMHLNDF
jgi:hypothetical protein